ncbi:MAG: nitrogen regulation protein NR(II) [Acidobacteriota bacterium]
MKRVSPTVFLGFAVLLTAMILVWLVQGSYKDHDDSLMAEKREHRIEELTELILHLNEMLDMSARLAAVTGDPQWDRRYHELEPGLAAAINESIHLAPGSYGGTFSAQTSAVHQALVAKEQEAFHLVRQGLLEEAQAVLNSEEYEKQRAIYVRGLENLLTALHESTRAAHPARERNAFLQPIAAVAAVSLLLLLWLVVRKRRRDEEQRLRNVQTEELLASISSVLIGVDSHGRVTNWNAAAESLFGIRAADAIGRPFRDCGIRWDWPTVLEGVSECLEQKRPRRIEVIRFEHIAGNEGVLGATVNPIAGESSGSAGFLLLGADLTEQAFLENQLLQAQKLESVGQLAAGIAHEINTPTQYVGDNTRFLQEVFGEVLEFTKKVDELTKNTRSETGSSELAAQIRAAMDKVDLDYLGEEIPQAIQQALEGIDRVTRIVRAMKEFSHPLRDKTAIDINRAIESTITVARNEWKYVAEMITELDLELPPVSCFPGEFNQVILNLIVNAADAIAEVAEDGTPSKGTITVTTRQTGGWAEIGVADTGAGIPEDIQGKIFDPFFTTKEVGKGTGQGLSLVHSVVVQKHGGKISVDSEPGKGTTFLIHLPLEDPATVDKEITA